jgi:glucokinase
VGGTKVAVTLATEHGFVGRLVEPTATTGAQDALGQQIVRMIAQSCRVGGVDQSLVQRVGVSSCGPFVMGPQGVELAAPNICGGLAGKARGLPNDWRSALLEAPLRERFAQVRVANDGVGALEAERRWGALHDQGTPLNHCAYVTWSTGIGVGLCIDGHVLQGKNGNAGHGGHTFVSTDHQALCGCGNKGDVEALVAGNAIPRRWGAEGFADASALFKACKAGDPRAEQHVEEMCHIMGRLLFNLIALGDLSRISLGGSVFWHNQDQLLPRLKHHALAPLPALTQGVDLVPAGLGEQVGDFAALALVA